ncbi:hypothetical protein [Phytopseudomonas daroniae]|uniref:hypothetical protein n=1 Tax=Phytopseudomonas daroniae TaxID=2487519 RepID=UPI0013F158AB|nr:hypothetical protein [Pseudomonas daroniae]
MKTKKAAAILLVTGVMLASNAHASMATSCADPRPWYTFSGIEALTCLFSGQW